MTTTDTLLDETDREIALLFLVDGIELAWTDHHQLVGYDTGAGHAVRLGLQREGVACKLAINVRDGQWLDSPATVTLVDYSDDGELAALFASRSTDERQLGDVPFGAGLPVHPSTDLSGRPDLDNQCIGLETIGSNGERHRYAVPPGFDVGMEHSITLPSLEIQGAPVTASPIVWTGRRCALYVILRDHVDDPSNTGGAASWRPFSEAKRIWCGTMRDAGRVAGRAWDLDLDGPDSFLRKPLATLFSPTHYKAIGEFALRSTEEEPTDQIYVALSSDSTSFGVRDWVTTLTATNVADMVAEVAAEIAACAAAGATPWNDQPGFHVEMDTEGRVSIAIEDSNDRGCLTVILHQSVWKLMGYDPPAQAGLYPDPSSPQAVSFWPADQNADGTPGSGYWGADFWTGQDDWPDLGDNGGGSRRYSPLYPGGTSILRSDLGDGLGQVVRLGLSAGLGGGTTVSHPGQLAWPIASSATDPAAPIEIDGTPCDRAGLWMFHGKRRLEGSDEVFDEIWVGLACWVNGSLAEDGLVDNDSIIVVRWLEPGHYGLPVRVDTLKDDWVSRATAEDDLVLKATPLAWIGYQPDNFDHASIVLQRLLYSTGTATEWDAPEQGTPAIVGGDNEPAGARVIPFDGEIADLGLAIPSDWIAPPDDWDAVVQQIDDGPAWLVKVAFTAGYQAEDVARSLMQPLGLAWHFRSGRLGIWCPSESLTLADATVVLDRSTRMTRSRDKGRRGLSQDLRKWQPVDTWKISANWHPLERKINTKLELQSPDGQYRYRPGEVSQPIMAHAHRGESWTQRILQMSRWWAMRHFEVRGYPVQQLTPGLDLWPGTIVRLTDPELVDPAGTYGVTNRIAIVTATQRTFGTDEGAMTVDLLVLGTRTSTPRVHAIMATGKGYDTGTTRLYAYDNWTDLAGQPVDASRFAEPTYTGIAAFGGNAVVECWQWDGEQWAVTLSGTVTSVDTTPGATYLQLSSTSGTYRRDMDTWIVLRPTTTANAAWVDAIFAPICDDASQWNDVATPTDGYPWEE